VSDVFGANLSNLMVVVSPNNNNNNNLRPIYEVVTVEAK
jgi:hypothetical protein